MTRDVGPSISARFDRTLPLDFYPPTHKEIAHAREIIRDTRLSALQQLARALRGDESVRLVTAIASCLDRYPESAVAFIDRWDVGFALRCLVESENESLAKRVLLAMAFASDERIRSCVEGFNINVVGQRDLALCGLRISNASGAGVGQRIARVRCRAGDVEIATMAGRRVRVTPPLRRGALASGLALRSQAVARSWQLSVVDADDFNLPAALFYGHEPNGAMRSRQSRSTNVRQSLERAYGVISNIWPAVPAWIRLLVPAVLRVRQRAHSGIRLSGSFGPGYPVYFSDTLEPHLLAEDVVHELQHLRFHIWRMDTGWPPPSSAGERFVSPFRPDLRPLLGVHLALHAFVTVNEFRLRTADRDPLTKASVADTALIHQRNLFAFHTVAEYEVLTRHGRRYLEALAQRLAEQHERISQLSTKAVRLRAERVVRQHIRRAALAGPALNADVASGWKSPLEHNLCRGGSRA